MGEFELIKELIARLPGPSGPVRVGPGDDAAVTDADRASATSVDVLIEGIHFTRPEFPADAIGRKTAVAGLSDLAAMGAEAGELYVVLGLPEDANEGFGLELFEGIKALLDDSGAQLAGGDVSRSPVLVLSVTAIGYEPEGSKLVTRSAASSGDAVVVTGELGGAAAGLKLLRGEVEDAPTAAAALEGRQLRPEPRLQAGRALAEAGATAMIDLSDGLGADAGHVADMSGVRIEIELAELPVQDGVADVAGSGDAALELATSGGEDYELLATLPPEKLDRARSAIKGIQLTEIGSVADGTGVSLRKPDGTELEPRGYEHF